MIFPAAELRQINLQCLDATQIPSGSRKSINRTAEGKRTSSKFWMWEPSAEAESGRTCPRFCGTGNMGEFPVGKGQIVPFFKLHFLPGSVSDVQNSCLENSWICVCNSTAPKHYQNKKNHFALPHWQVKSILYLRESEPCPQGQALRRDAEKSELSVTLSRIPWELEFALQTPPRSAHQPAMSPNLPAPADQGSFYLLNMELRRTHYAAITTKI